MDENQMQAESNQNRIMAALFENDELRFKDLQEKTGLSPPTLTKRLKAMETRGIIKKTKRKGVRWPYYSFKNPQYLKEFILPQFIWLILDEKYPEGTSLPNIAGMFGEVLLYILFKEKTNYRNHDVAIRGMVEIMRNSVNKWVEKGIKLESADIDKYYRRFIESDAGPEELKKMLGGAFERGQRADKSPLGKTPQNR
jgi:DNA-binding transcriptional ArsR family regulator